MKISHRLPQKSEKKEGSSSSFSCVDCELGESQSDATQGRVGSFITSLISKSHTRGRPLVVPEGGIASEASHGIKYNITMPPLECRKTVTLVWIATTMFHTFEETAVARAAKALRHTLAVGVTAHADCGEIPVFVRSILIFILIHDFHFT